VRTSPSGGLELRWLAREPSAAIARVAARLLLEADGDRLDLGDTTLRFVPDDDARGDGRLVLAPSSTAHPREARAVPPLRIAALGWATVETERALAEFAAALDIGTAGQTADPDRLLGGSAHVIADPRLPGGRVVLLEPTTEGRLAATLARDAEGPCVLYLRPADGLDAWIGRARSHGIACSRPDAGPLGRSALVLGGSVAGPHLLVVETPDLSSRP
jgi:hypothetical protein